MQPRWDLISVILYCTMGYICYVCSSQALICKQKLRYKDAKVMYAIWFIIWVLFASLRYVTNRIGGTDAPTYVYFFENIDSPYLPVYYQHYDKGFWLLTRLIRLITDNYHIYFIIFYGIIAYCYIKFVDEFSETWGVYTSYFMIIFLFLRGFASFRTNISVAFLLLSLVYLKRENKARTIIFVIIACSMHKATILYALFYVFYWINKRKPISIKAGVVFSILAGFVGMLARNYIGLFFDSSVDAYASYARRSIGVSFFDNFWKIAFGQLALLIMMVIFNRDIMKMIHNESNGGRHNIELLRTICIYDFILIPITFILGIWRGCEYFYIPRMAMWGIIIRIEMQKISEHQYRILYRIFTLLVIVGWFVYRLNSIWEDSSLLPYVFAPFL